MREKEREREKIIRDIYNKNISLFIFSSPMPCYLISLMHKNSHKSHFHIYTYADRLNTSRICSYTLVFFIIFIGSNQQFTIWSKTHHLYVYLSNTKKILHHYCVDENTRQKFFPLFLSLFYFKSYQSQPYD